jgi:hypothetical protein
MKKPIAFLTLLLIAEVSLGQSFDKDDSARIYRTINYYYNGIAQNAPIFNGSTYVGYGQKIIGTPFFGSDVLKKGTIFYEGVLYQNIEMAYDVAGDCIVIKDHLNDNLLIQLVNQKIGYFIINDHFFVNSDGTGNDQASNGFFDRIYDGKHIVWVKRRKQIEDKPLDEKEKSTFVDYNTYYIKNENQFVAVNNLTSLLKVFGDKKKLVRKYLRDHQLKFKSDPEKTITEAAWYYDSLAN